MTEPLSPAEVETLRGQMKSAMSNLWTDASTRGTTHRYIDQLCDMALSSTRSAKRCSEMVECESCIGSGKIREQGDTPQQDRWRRCMDCTGTGKVPAERAEGQR